MIRNPCLETSWRAGSLTVVLSDSYKDKGKAARAHPSWLDEEVVIIGGGLQGVTAALALAGGIVEVPDAIYLKRLHRQSATYLTEQSSGADLFEALVGEVNARFPEGGDARGRALEVAELVVASAAAARSSHEPGTLKKIIRRLVNEPRPYYE